MFFSMAFHLILEIGLSLKLEFTDSARLVASKSASPRDLPMSFLIMLELQAHVTVPAFYEGYRDTN